MNAMWRWLSALVVINISCCSRTHSEEEHHHGAVVQQREALGDDSDNVVRIHPEMLRDLRITTDKVGERASGEGVSILGEVVVSQDASAEIHSPIVANVTRVLVTHGDDVRAGQPLIELQSVELGQARAALITANAHAQAARKSLDRKRTLAAEKIISARELEEAEAQLQTADAETRAAAARLSALGFTADDVALAHDASRFVIRAPLSGTVIDRSAVLGQNTDPSDTLLRLADMSKLWVVAHAFERDAIRIEKGSKVRINFLALPGRAFDGVVAVVGKQVDTSSRTLPIRIVVDNAQRVLRPGMSANVWIPLGNTETKIVAVPSAAVQRTPSGWSVYIPKAEGTFEARTVGRGRDLGGEVEILSGLSPGETVVVDGAFLLKAEAEKANSSADEHDH